MDIGKVKTILLDNDGTIMDFSKAQRVAFEASCRKLGYDMTEESYRLYHEINKKYWELFEKNEVTKDRLKILRFEEYFETTGIKGDPYSMEEVYQALLGEQSFLLDGARDGVERLSRKYKIYVATNGVEETQKNRFRLSGLMPYIGKIFISEEIGYQKPQREFFEYVFSNSDAERESTVIVGDSLTSDIQGGKNAGITTVWFNRKNKVPTIIPDYSVGNWQELLELFSV